VREGRGQFDSRHSSRVWDLIGLIAYFSLCLTAIFLTPRYVRWVNTYWEARGLAWPRRIEWPMIVFLWLGSLALIIGGISAVLR
jgi:hypothetical protein